MMKRIFAMILALLLVCSLVACSKDDNEDDEGVDLTVTSDGNYYDAKNTYHDRIAFEIINGNEAAITGFVSDYTPHEIVIPDMIEGCPVVEIADTAFYHCSQITSVTVPSTVRKIGKMAFAGCTQLAAIKFVNNASALATVDEFAFAYCKSLASFTMFGSVNALGMGAFYDCQALTSIELPAGITALSDMTFMGCEKLATVSGGTALLSVGNYAFRGCVALSSFTIAASVTSIGDFAFSGCEAFTAPTLGSGVTVGQFAFE